MTRVTRQPSANSHSLRRSEALFSPLRVPLRGLKVAVGGRVSVVSGFAKLGPADTDRFYAELATGSLPNRAPWR